MDLDLPEIDFGSCYERIISSEEQKISELIIAIIDKKMEKDKDRKVIKYGLFSPITGKYLNSEEICKDDKIMVEDSIENKILESGVDVELLKYLVNDGVDVFNLSSPFYNDICFQYNSKKDVALKDRVLEYFPNISLCEEGCDFVAINMTTITSICECYFSKSTKEEILKDKVLEQAQIGFIEDVITSSNIYVIKCVTLLIDGNNIKKCYGGFIILCFVLAEILCAIIYCTSNIYSINKYIFILLYKYINFLRRQQKNKIDERQNENNSKNDLITKSKNNNNAPVQKRLIKLANSKDKMNSEKKLLGKRQNGRKTIINGNINLVINNHKGMKSKNNYANKNPNNTNTNNVCEKPLNKSGTRIQKLLNQGDISEPNAKDFVLNHNSEIFVNVNKKEDLDINIVEYLKTKNDDMDYDEAIRKDHRKFFECFIEKIKNNHIIINIFCEDEFIKPRSIKILLLILQIILYFFINGLFYDEEYISKIYHLDKDTFFTMAERFFDNLIYAAIAGIIINYIIEFFFVDEIKIKKILKMEKDNILILKYEMIKVLKSIRKRYLAFIITSFIITFIALIHIFCFNVVYFHTMKEWIAFSVIIILSIHIGSFLIYLLQTALRFLSFKFKSEKLFKLSL